MIEDPSCRYRIEEGSPSYRTIVEAAPDVLLRLTPEGRIATLNPAFERDTAWTAVEWLGRPFLDLVHPEDQAPAERQFARVATGEALPPFTLRVACAAGRHCTWEIRIAAVYEDNAISGIVCVARNSAERQRQEQQEFLMLVAHELRNPLATLRAQAEVMQQYGDYSPKRVESILVQAGHLDRLIDDVLFLARLEEGYLSLKPEPADLGRLAQAAVQEARARSPQHRFTVQTPDPPLTGRWDPHRLTQVLRNLLSNAVKYSFDGGDIHVRVTRAEGEAQISVEDNGAGISVEALPHLFDRFFRAPSALRTARGLGAGLYVCRLLVEAHGGQIWAESAGEGLGSTFYVRLPLG